MSSRRARKLFCVLFLVGLASLSLALTAAAQPPPQAAANDAMRNPSTKLLRGGWYPSDPYQYRLYRYGIPILTGFDVEIERALARVMGVELTLTPQPWADQLAAIAAGKADLAAGATYTPERETYAYFSQPYRNETDVLILPRGAGSRYNFRTIEQMLNVFASQHFRLGVIAGYVYADDRVNRFIADPANQAHIVRAADDAENLQDLLDGRTDGFLADRISGITTAWRQHKGSLIEEYPLRFSTDIHFMLSRASQNREMLARLDAAINEIRRSGEFRRIADAYALPVLIHQTLDSDWFQVLALLGTVAFALSGVLLAYAGNYTLFGAVILASLPAVGGGVVRDLLLQRTPLGIVRDPMTLLTVFATVLAGMVVIRTASLFNTRRLARYLRLQERLGPILIKVCDAVGLAAFLVVGVVVALDTSAEPLWLWGPISAGITSSFGGLIRDLFRHDRLVANLRGELYPEIAVVWGLALSLFFEWEAERLQPEEIGLGVVVTIVGAFLTRMVAVARRVKGWPYV